MEKDTKYPVLTKDEQYIAETEALMSMSNLMISYQNFLYRQGDVERASRMIVMLAFAKTKLLELGRLMEEHNGKAMDSE